ncbi:hypothetical protein GCM10019993_16400 [Enterococcus pseudoavium]
MDIDYKDYYGGYLPEHELLNYYHKLGVSYVNDGSGRTSNLGTPLLLDINKVLLRMK